MKKRSVLLLSILVIMTVGAVVGYKMWNKPFKDPLQGDAVKVTAIQLFNDFSVNEAEAQKKYVPVKLGDKKVEVTGQISAIGKNESGETFYTLKTSDEIFGVRCIMDKGEKVQNAKVGDNITVRGFCDGYNMDVIVNRCKPI